MRLSSTRSERGPLPLLLLAASALGISLPGPGCRKEEAKAPPLPQTSAARLSGPTKDEVALVDGRPLSIFSFQSLRALLSALPAETVLWIGTAALALQNQSRTTGKELEASQALDVVLYSLGRQSAGRSEASLRRFFRDRPSLPSPIEAKAEIDALLSRSLVQRNEALFSELKQP